MISELLNFRIGKIRASKSCFMICLLFSFIANAQEIVELYPGSVPNSKKSEKKETFNSGMFRGVTKPTLEVYLPEKEKATGAAVIIIPGGGYSVVVYQGEGVSNAKQFAKNGIAGRNPSNEQINEYSNELQVTNNTPPTYITHAADDKTVDVDNSIVYFESLRHHNVDVEMHLYPKGGHGFIFRQPDWIEPLLL